MKLILALALTVALAAAAVPNVETTLYTFSTMDWFTTLFDLSILQMLISFYGMIGFFTALFGSPKYFPTNAY
jgi:hypothetical protein